MWTPREIRKLLVLLTGIGLEIAGVVMLIQQVKSTGSIDINSSLISGKIESGSAGLLICFIGLFVIALSIIGGKDTIIHSSVSGHNSDKKEMTLTSLNLEQKRGLLIILVFGFFTLALIFGGIHLEKSGWKGSIILTVFGVFCAIGEAILILSFIDSFLDIQKPEDPK